MRRRFAAVLPDGEYEGGVQENQLPGKEVMTMLAVDDDDPNENGNAVLSYQLLDDSSRIFPTSLTGDVTSEIAEDDWERGCNYDIIMPYACRIKSFKKTPINQKIKRKNDSNNRRQNNRQKGTLIACSKRSELSLPEIILFKYYPSHQLSWVKTMGIIYEVPTIS